MVRVLSCHHFKSQKIGRCDGGIGVALADQIVIVALEHLISVYCSDHIANIPAWFAKRRAADSFAKGSIGGQYHFDTLPAASSPAKEHSPNPTRKKDVTQESLVLSHTFPPVDLIESIAYNQRGHYLLCQERRESSGDSVRVRVYFHWDRPLKGRPMKARIAGLVSPTGGDVDSESLIMVEIAPEPLFATIATASCQHSANIVTLSADSRVNIYCFRLKEGSGRGRLQYADFDLTVTLQLETVATRIAFALNHIGTIGGDEALILKLKYLDAPLSSSDRKKDKPPQSAKNTQKATEVNTETVFYNPKKLDPSQQVLLPTIQKENRKQRQPPGYIEEFGKEIRTGKASLTIPLSQQMKHNRGNLLAVDDILRVKRDTKQSSSPLVHLSLHPQRIGNTIGGTLCLLATENDMLIYHLPEVDGGSLKRVAKCPFTGPLQQLRFDLAFIHALTESGIETYSKRGLSEALRDIEGFSALNNDCPLQEESPCLLGIRPFPGVRFVEANEHSICLLSAPSNNQQSTNNELWTIYLLESPPADQFYEDAMRGADAHRESSPEVYLTLLSEIHLFLRDRINQKPHEEPILREKYRHTTRLLGLQFFRNANSEPEIHQEELLNRGIAFLQMAYTDAKFFFRHENHDIPKDPQLVTGIAKFLRLTLPLSGGEEFPPSLSKAIVDFLGTNSLSDLARVTIETPWLREAQGQRILSALRTDSSPESGWRKDLALILVIVSVHGRDTEGIDEIMKLLKHADTLSLEKNIKVSWILETRKNKVRLSDLAISLAMTRTSIHTNVVVHSLEAGSGGVCFDDMIVAFHQGVNLNADLSVKEALTKDLRSILEGFFIKRAQIGIEKEDEVRALHLLISSYLPNILQQTSKRPTLSPLPASNAPAQEPFGIVPSFVHALVDDEPSVSAIAKEHFYALASLLLSSLGNTKGAKDLVLRAIANQTETVFGFPLALLTESRDRVLDLLLSRRPELLLLYAKETFGSSVDGWKLVVMKLKEKIGTHPTNQDLITTVTESVYLHLANSLSPSALEEVLEKEEEKDHFLDASKRVDLANAFADKVVQMSLAFLSRP